MGKRGRAGSSHPPGGYKQQLKWNTESAPGVAKPSSLAVFLVKQWAWGHLSSPMLQKIAFHALQDGAAHADLQKLARLGTSGMHQQNIHTELVRCLHEQSTTRSLSTMQVYVKQMHTHVRCEQHVLLPHELFAALYHNHRDAFTKRMLGGDPANIAKWWTAMHNHPGYVAHPLKDRANHMQKCVPLALHGDGVPVTGVGKAWGKSAEGYGWSSMIGVGTTVDVYFLIWIMYTKLIVRSPGLDSSKTFFQKIEMVSVLAFPRIVASTRRARDSNSGRQGRGTPRRWVLCCSFLFEGRPGPHVQGLPITVPDEFAAMQPVQSKQQRLAMDRVQTWFCLGEHCVVGCSLDCQPPQ